MTTVDTAHGLLSESSTDRAQGPRDLGTHDAARRARVDSLVAQGLLVKRCDYDGMREFAEEALELAVQPDHDGQRYTHGMAGALSLLAYRSCCVYGLRYSSLFIHKCRRPYRDRGNKPDDPDRAEWHRWNSSCPEHGSRCECGSGRKC